MELACYPLHLATKTIEKMIGAELLTCQQKTAWGKWQLSIIERHISIETGLPVEQVGRPAWAIKNNKMMRSQSIKRLIVQRKVLKQYIKNNK